MAIPGTERELPLWLRPWAIYLFVAIVLAVRLFVASHTGLVVDEAYYTLWSLWPQFGYFDHPPMVAWTIATGRALLGESELAVRLVSVLATGITALAVYRTGRVLFDTATAGIAVIWFNVTVAAGLLFVATPDAPAIMFWALSVWATAEFVARRNANWWLLTGLFAGLGLLSKYTTGFLGLGLLLFLVTSRERLGWLRLWQVWAGAGIALLVFAPNFAWNARNGWASIAFQGRRLGDYGLTFGSFPANLGDYVGGQALATGLFLFIFTVIGGTMFFLRRDLPGRAGLALPVFTSLPLLAYFGYYCLSFRVEANWPAAVWPVLSLAGAWAVVHVRPDSRIAAAPLALFRWAQVPLGVALVTLIYVQAVWQPWSIGQSIDRTRDMRGWAGLHAEVAAHAEANGTAWTASIGRYGLASELAIYARFAGDRQLVWHLGDEVRYGFRPPLDPELAERPALVVTPGEVTDIGDFFETARLVGTAARRQRDEVLEEVNVFVASGLKQR